MEFKIRINSILVYENKDSGELNTRISYNFLGKEYFQISDRFIGVSEQTLYVDRNVIDKFNPEDLKNKPYVIKAEEVPTLKNPLKKYTKVTEIKLDDAVIVSL